MVSFDDAKSLIDLARNSITTVFNKKSIDFTDSKIFSDMQGVFVTLHKLEKLRGCIGYPRAYYPLYEGVIRAARAAAFEDPRFPKVTSDELEDITIEISILTVPKKIEVDEHSQYPHLINIGKDGLIISKGNNSGLLLPQVFVEHNCTPVQALEFTCQKAGLHNDAWKDDEVEIQKFQSQVFKEEEPHGKIIEVM